MAAHFSVRYFDVCCLFRTLCVTSLIIFLSLMFPMGSLRAEGLSDYCAPYAYGKVGSKPARKNYYEDVIKYKELASGVRYRGERNTPQVNSLGFKHGHEDNTQVIPPDPLEDVISNGKALALDINVSKVDVCAASISKLQALEPMESDKKYACALLMMDQDCLTSSAEQANIPDPQVPKRSLVIMSFYGKAFCTGMLLDEHTIITARHCFIRQSDGSVHKEFDVSGMPGFSVQTMDVKRRVVISKEAISALRVSGSFDIEKDPVKIPVETVKAMGALPLPKVIFKPAQAKQLLWVAGPFALLDQAMAMKNAYLNPSTPSSVDWQDSIRWSNSEAAQCRVEAVNKACIYHTCQTSEGYSGSPMISAVYADSTGANKIIEVVGVHSGTPGSIQGGGWPACATSSASFNASDYSAYNVGRNGGF